MELPPMNVKTFASKYNAELCLEINLRRIEKHLFHLHGSLLRSALEFITSTE
jgi:hypothetical protein